MTSRKIGNFFLKLNLWDFFFLPSLLIWNFSRQKWLWNLCTFQEDAVDTTLMGKRNPATATTWDVKNPVNNRIHYLSTGEGFLPSTVVNSYFFNGDTSDRLVHDGSTSEKENEIMYNAIPLGYARMSTEPIAEMNATRIKRISTSFLVVNSC